MFSKIMKVGQRVLSKNSLVLTRFQRNTFSLGPRHYNSTLEGVKPLEDWSNDGFSLHFDAIEVQKWFTEDENGRFAKWAPNFALVNGKELSHLCETHIIHTVNDHIAGSIL